MSVLSEAKIREYRETGAVHLPGVFAGKWLDKIRNGIEENLRNPSAFSERLRNSPGEGAYFNDYCNWRGNPDFRDLVFDSPAAEIAGRLMGTQKR